MGPIVYVLCALTSLGCAVLLARGYRRSRARLLLWSALCFFGITLQNVFLFVDLVLVPQLDLSIVRNAIAFVSVAMLVFGLIWEGE